MNTTSQVTESEVIAFVVRCQDAISEHFAKSYPNVGVTALSIATGRRYIKIVATDSSGTRYAWGFVDMATGDLLKPASWKGPEKNFARGNVRNIEGVAKLVSRIH